MRKDARLCHRVAGKMDAVLSVVAKSVDSGTQGGDVLAAAEVAIGRLVVVVASALTRVAMIIAVAEPEGGTDVGLPLAAVSAERTKASSRQDLQAPLRLLLLAGRTRHKKTPAEHE
jgi:hypothetical protein